MRLRNLWLFFLFSLVACERESFTYLSLTELDELAMNRIMTIEVENSFGVVKIKSVSPLKRIVEVNNNSYKINLIKRKEATGYRLGAYDPADRLLFDFWSGRRIVFDDNFINFSSHNEMIEYFMLQDLSLDWVAHDEWVVGFRSSESRGQQINISVFRVKVNGQAPYFPKKNFHGKFFIRKESHYYDN